MQRHRPVRSMRIALGTLIAGVVLAAAGGAASHWAAPIDVHDSTPTPTAFTQLLQATPVHELVSPDGRGGYATVFEQVGRVVAISDWSLTASSPDGTIKTYVMTPRTTTLALGSVDNGRASARFSIDEVVSIVGTVEGGTMIATVVADQALANGNGPPMD